MGLNKKVEEIRKKSANPNIEGEEAPNVRTDREGTSDVPASRQSAIRPKESKKKDRDPSNK
jgi:hypothetical protein